MSLLRHTKKRTITAASALLILGLLPVGATAQVAHAETAGPITFESYALESINGQDGWSSTGAFDQEVVASSRFTSFGQSLRISNAVTSGSFGNQTFSPALANLAGESPAEPHFDATFEIGTTSDVVQPGLVLSVSPDNGVGGRMSYLRFEDQPDGVHVFFDDVTDRGPYYRTAKFNEKKIATLDRASAHVIRFSIDFVDGPANDVVKIFIDGALEATGTTWEDYYRFDNENQGAGVVPTVSTLLFKAGGAAAPGTLDGGFLFDNLTLTSSPALVAPLTSKCLKDGWMTFNDPAFKNQGDCVSSLSTGGKNAANG